MRRLFFLVLVLMLVGMSGWIIRSRAAVPGSKTVVEVAPARLDIQSGTARGQLPLYVSADWSKPLPDITRVVLVLHGILRDANVSYAGGLQALSAAGDTVGTTLVIAPQFLTAADAAAHRLAAETLTWERDNWTGGGEAMAPAAISSFVAVDAILARLADTALFPNLKHVVVAGHSGGGQIVQRYAVVGKGESKLTERGIAVRYVVANPSSYVYFNDRRPQAEVSGGASCAEFNAWKYGFAAGLPAYVDQSTQTYAQRYAARDVIYLLGTKDTNPRHPALDKSCMAQAQGANRYARGHGYFDQLRAEFGAGLTHKLYDVADVGHAGPKMFASKCGLAALFDQPGCAAK